MTRTIEVLRIDDGADALRFEVVVREAASETRHVVSVSQKDFARLGGDANSPERFVDAAFRFLLDREPKESILARFDVSVVSRYFPEFERALPNYLAGKR
jgi:hypothetical protein